MEDSQKNQPSNAQLFVQINNPDHVLFSDYARAVTSYNKRGAFDVLFYHANFISLITKSIIVHRDNAELLTIPLENGIMKVYENTVNVLIGIKTEK